MTSTAVNIRNYRTEVPGSLSEDRLSWVFPQINSKDNFGHNTEWKIMVRILPQNSPTDSINFIPIDDKYFDSAPIPAWGWRKVYSRIEGGKVRDSVPTITTIGKNIGKSNQTNAFTQTMRDALSLYNKQLRLAMGVVNTQSGIERHRPMLATMFKDLKKPIDYTSGVFVQRKFDGVRAVAVLDPSGTKNALGEVQPAVIMYSRTALPYLGFGYIKDELFPVLKDYIAQNKHIYLDGEIYKHGIPLQDISGYARRGVEPDDVRVDYMIYDLFTPDNPDMKYKDRQNLLNEIFDKYGPFEHIKSVETYQVSSVEEINKYYDGFIREGYEGAMVRLNEPYKNSKGGYHSKVLLKIKPSYDAEFTIIGHDTGTAGKAAEALMFVCKTDEGVVFNVTPAMELEERIKLASLMDTIEENGETYFANNYLGKKLIVYFDDWSKDKVPQRARTKGQVRTWE